MLDFAIVGAAQAGLSMAYYIKKQTDNFLLVDKENEIGYSWLNRWDSLKLFTPSEFNNMPGMDFPAPKGHYPSKYEVAEYFKSYAEENKFPIQLNTFIEKIEKKENHFELFYEDKILKAKAVIIATGPFHIPFTPDCHQNVSEEIFQTHSNYYKNPKQLQEGATLVVGDGDSGFQILDEISKTGRKTYYSGSTEIKTLPQEILGKTLWWWFTKTGFLSISKDTWLGKRIMHNRQPIIGTDVKEILNRENVISVGYTTDADKNIVFTEKTEIKDLKNIIWATGYKPNFEWIKDLELTEDNYPKHIRGVSTMDDLYFIGLPWLYTRGSATLGGIQADAEFLDLYIKSKKN